MHFQFLLFKYQTFLVFQLVYSGKIKLPECFQSFRIKSPSRSALQTSSVIGILIRKRSAQISVPTSEKSCD